MMNMKGLHTVAWLLLVVGGLNWLLQGVFGWEVGSYLPGGMAGTAATVLYILVGLSAVVEIATHKNNCKMCGTSGPTM